MRALVVAGDNSFSHAAKAMALKEVLEGRGHEVHLATGPSAAAFFRRFGVDVAHILPDLSGRDGSAFPTVAWFRDTDWVQGCMRAEENLIRSVRPDLVVGVFRFTLHLSTLATGRPYYSVCCGCVLRECPDILGFRTEEGGWEIQDDFMRSFFLYGGRGLLRAAGAGHGNGLADARDHLKGRMTFLWDFPEFQPLATSAEVRHVGPFRWAPDLLDPELPPVREATGRPFAVVAFGTCNRSARVTGRIVKALDLLGFRVVVADGGHRAAIDGIQGHNVTVLAYPPLERLIARADLLVCHGGQLTVFEALAARVPVLVVPFHPEQAQNGVCLERIGCGKRLVVGRAFLGNPSVFLDQVGTLTEGDLARRIETAMGQISRLALERASQTLDRYRGAVAVAESLEAQG